MTKALITASILLLVAAIIMSFRGDRHQRKERHNTADMIKHMDRKLNLTDVQKTAISASLKELEITRNKMNLLHEEMEQKMIHQLANSSFDQEGINNFYESKEAEYSNARQQMIANMGDIHAALTPEQRQKMKELMANRRGKHRNRR